MSSLREPAFTLDPANPIIGTAFFVDVGPLALRKPAGTLRLAVFGGVLGVPSLKLEAVLFARKEFECVGELGVDLGFASSGLLGGFTTNIEGFGGFGGSFGS